ncbi:hypothetical protein L1887_58204 [Cichorium endivia]|nr:hypothetical protein L1887_58204 [Cichorium endivia]
MTFTLLHSPRHFSKTPRLPVPGRRGGSARRPRPLLARSRLGKTSSAIRYEMTVQIDRDESGSSPPRPRPNPCVGTVVKATSGTVLGREPRQGVLAQSRLPATARLALTVPTLCRSRPCLTQARARLPVRPVESWAKRALGDACPPTESTRQA